MSFLKIYLNVWDIRKKIQDLLINIYFFTFKIDTFRQW